jgi:hypothetical protein
MHFDVEDGVPGTAAALEDITDAECVAACYRCVMSYFNQPDHELLDRRDEGARTVLLRLARSRLGDLASPRAIEVSATASGAVASQWLDFARARLIPEPDLLPLSVDGRELPFVWRQHYAVAVLEAPDAPLQAQLEQKGLSVVVLGAGPPDWPETTAALAKLLGVVV